MKWNLTLKKHVKLIRKKGLRDDGRDRTTKSGKCLVTYRTKNGNYLGILETNLIKRIAIKEKVRIGYLRTTKKYSRNKILWQESHQMKIHLSGPACKIIWTILKMDKGATLKNRINDKEIDYDTQGFTPDRLYRKTI